MYGLAAEIDIMGEQDKDTALFGECKWTNEKVDRGVLETLTERSSLFAYQKKHFFLFSRSGFTKECMEKAKEMENYISDKVFGNFEFIEISARFIIHFIYDTTIYRLHHNAQSIYLTPH